MAMKHKFVGDLALIAASESLVFVTLFKNKDV